MKKVVTGSQVFGVPKENSDIDIVLIRSDATKLKKALIEKDIEIDTTEAQRVYGEGFYFYIGGLTFNIIHADDVEELGKWYVATREMVKLPEIEDRYKRINTFQKIRGNL